VAARCGDLLKQIAAEHGWEIMAKEVIPITCTCSCVSARPMRQRK